MPEKVKKYPPMSVKELIEGTCRLDGESVEIYDFQRKFFDSKSNFRIVNKARQIGFSSAIAMEALYKAIWYPNKTILFISTGDRTSRNLMRKFNNLLNSMEPFEINFEVEGENKLATNKLNMDTIREKSFKNNSRVVSLPNNPDNIRGYQATDVYIDEFAFFENPAEVWTAVIPSLTRGENITLISTPAGTVGEFYKKWDESERQLNDFQRFKFPYSNIKNQLPNSVRKNVDKIKETMSDVQFKQEYECEFIDENISMFPYEILKPCVNDNVPNAWSRKTANPIYMGVDFGLHRNSTVIVIVEKTEEGWVVMDPIKEFIGQERKENEQGDADFEPVMIWIQKALKDLRPTRCFVDANGMGERLCNELRRDYGGLVVPVKATNEMKERLIWHMRVLFENQQIVIPRNDLLMSQLHDMRKKVTAGGVRSQYKPGPGNHDDACWALGYALTPETKPTAKPIIRGIRR